MRKQKGSILAITIGFALVFIIFGLTSLYLSGLQREDSEKQTHKVQAFWLAEAGIQRGFWRLPDTTPINNEPLGNGSYNVSITPLSSVRWIIDSVGSVYSQTREIQVEAGPNVLKAIITTGTLRSTGGGGLDDHIDPDGSYEEEAEYLENPDSFEKIFGIPEATMSDLATHTYNPPNNPDITDGINWIHGELKITKNTWSHSSILIVEGSLEMEGGHFDGIIWVKGAAKMINGGNLVDGAVIIQDLNPNPGETKINGNAALEFDKVAIDNAFSIYSSSNPEMYDHINIVSWQEVYQ